MCSTSGFCRAGAAAPWLLLFSLAPPAGAYPTAVPNAAVLAAQADVVCIGEFILVRDESGPDRQVARFQVDRLLKGRLDEPAIAIELIRDPAAPPVLLAAGEYSLVFLKRDAEGVYRLVDPFISRMRVNRTPPPAGAEAATTTQLLQREFINSLEEASADTAATAIEQLANFPGEASVAALREKLARPDAGPERGAVLASLIRLKQYSVLPEARRFVEQAAADPDLTNARSIVSFAVAGIADEAAAASLEPGLQSSDVGFRRAAARALRFSNPRAAAPSMAGALEDPDPEVRYDCLAALAQLVDDPEVVVPSRDEYLRRETDTPAPVKDRLLRILRLRGMIGNTERSGPRGFQLH